jgi:hypothetical protein
MLTSHVVLPPTGLGLAGLDPEQLCQKLAKHDDAPRSLVRRNLSPLVLDQIDPASIQDLLYFMTGDEEGH